MVDNEKTPDPPSYDAPGSLDEKRNETIRAASHDTENAESVDGIDDVKEQSYEERALVRKLDKRILPIACLMYLFACESEQDDE
jgi:hypothetical protein